ncbi:Acetyl esterase/lipase [Chitinophaga costaii]|uniref:Acetyl esterase/lipase n=1 Tax=Chitinophaga costaii TaxID=1335309 RepID=A0A1C4DEB5_9BACT|nr:alpha/beta hydrolase [Chitinophaga costaii]PUZ24593.1 alpha/beta hydrolase [Chitinophaga costaii]SCC29707.1 Acetyl esterase/lipase [Chitinophaga costaii]
MQLQSGAWLLLLCTSLHLHAQGFDTPLYEAGIPNSTGHFTDETWSNNYAQVRQVSKPYLLILTPKQHKLRTSAVIIFPGDGYNYEEYEREGKAIGMELVKQNVTAFIVRYRLPDSTTMKDPSIGPIQDAQQAIQLARSAAKDLLVDPDRIGVMGFSAGGHLAAMAGTQFDTAYVPRMNNNSVRPDFMILVCPVISMKDPLAPAATRERLLGTAPTAALEAQFSNELHVTDQTPPTYLIYAKNDSIVSPRNSIVFYNQLKMHGVDAHIEGLDNVGHAFAGTIPTEQWTKNLFAWMRQSGWILDMAPEDIEPEYTPSAPAVVPATISAKEVAL